MTPNCGAVLDGIVGFLTYVPRLILLGVGKAIKIIISGITALGGAPIDDISDIIFTDGKSTNNSSLISVDFFNINGGYGQVKAIRKSVAVWYYALRNIAIVILLIILLYVGLRIATSTIASEEAKYKTMFKDWIVSFVLVFVMHYIMVFVIEVNKVLVTTMYNASGLRGTDNSWSSYMGRIVLSVLDVNFSVGWGALIVYLLMIGMTILYLFAYVRRMITVGFLIVISPLVTITYAADKMGDTKSQALNTWLKEFVYNILIQPFHCIIYIVFVSTSISLLRDSPSMAKAVLAVVMILFMNKAEDIVKNIFNFNSKSMASAVGSAAALTAGFSFIRKSAGAKSAAPSANKIPKMDNPQFDGNSSSSEKNIQTSDKTKLQKDNSGIGGSASQSKTTGKSTNNGNSSNAGVNEGNSDNDVNQYSDQSNSADVPNGNVVSTNDEAQGGNNQNEINNKRKLKEERRKRQIAKVGKQIGNGARYTAKTAGVMAAYVALGAIGAAAGKEGFFAGITAAESLKNWEKNKYNKKGINRAVKNNEKKFASAYDKYKEQSGLNETQLRSKTQNYLNGNYDIDKMNDDEYEYFSYVQKMQKTYSMTGENEIEDKMMETLDMIENNEIKRVNNKKRNNKGYIPKNNEMYNQNKKENQGTQPEKQSPQNSTVESENGASSSSDEGKKNVENNTRKDTEEDVNSENNDVVQEETDDKKEESEKKEDKI